MVDGHRGLAGNRLDQPLMLDLEWFPGGAYQDQRAEDMLLGFEGGGEHSLGRPLRAGRLVAGVLGRVFDQGGGAMLHHPADHALSDLEGVDLLERDRDPDGRLDPQLGPGVIEQEQAGSIEGHQLVEPLEHLPQRSIEVERRAQSGADLGQQPERWLGSRAAAMQYPKPGGNSATTALGLADRRVVGHAGASLGDDQVKFYRRATPMR